MITVGQAREAARDWISIHVKYEPGFRGAYFIGSTVGLPDEVELATGSDLDVAIVADNADPLLKPGKLLHHDALLEISLFPWSWFESVDQILSSYHLAAGLQQDTIIEDPSGALHQRQLQVARSFHEEAWVRRRCEDALNQIKQFLLGIDQSESWADKILAWLFATGVTTHVLLVAALKNPTVRLRYLAVREVLTQYGQENVFDTLLDLLGCAEFEPERVQHHLKTLAHNFDAATKIAKTHFPFSSDITSSARPIAIDGIQKLIASGNHREAIFWITVTFARCDKILASDAPLSIHQEYVPAFEEILSDLGIRSPSDLLDRAERIRRFLPILWKTAEVIIAANLDVVKRGT
ncbi:MAG: hypothetical protein WC750_06545 [Patescibacteria group bacterium]|jgi:hypothetical protein